MKCAYDEGMKAEVFDTVDRIGRESMDLLSDDVKKSARGTGMRAIDD